MQKYAARSDLKGVYLIGNFPNFTELEVTVITGHKKMAGTDARVYLTLYGKSGMSPKLHLPDDKNKKRFERNSEDKFKFKVKDIGEIKRIR